MASFKVTTQTLEDKATTIKTINTQFNGIMEEITTLMHRLQNDWQSEAAEQFISRFDKLKNEFTSYSKVIDSYSLFLTNAAGDYAAAETAINTGAGNLFS